MRTWESSGGGHTTKAELISIEQDHVLLKKEDGGEIRVPLEKLSQRDRRFVVAELKKQKEQPAAEKKQLVTEPLLLFQGEDTVNDVLVSPDGRHVVWLDRDFQWSRYDLEKQEVVESVSLRSKYTRVQDAKLIRENRNLAVLVDKDEIVLIDTSTGTELGTLTVPVAEPPNAVMAARGYLDFRANDAGTIGVSQVTHHHDDDSEMRIHLWDLVNKKHITEIKASNKKRFVGLTDIAFAEGEDIFLVQNKAESGRGKPTTVTAYKAQDGNLLSVDKMDTQGWNMRYHSGKKRFIFDSCGRIIVCNNKGVLQWKSPSNLDGSSCVSGGFDFDKDFTIIANGAIDTVVRVWDARNGALIQELRGAEGRIESVALAPDASFVVVADGRRYGSHPYQKGAVRAWPIGKPGR